MIDVAFVVVAVSVTVLIFVWLVIRSRKRRNEGIAYARTLQAAFEEAQQKKLDEKRQAWLARYTREMSQRRMDRYYGHRPPGDNPTFEEWAKERGIEDMLR